MCNMCYFNALYMIRSPLLILIYADVISLNGTEANRGVSTEHVHKPGELSKRHSAHISESIRNSDAEFLDVDAANSHGKCDRRVNEANEPVFLDEFS